MAIYRFIKEQDNANPHDRTKVEMVIDTIVLADLLESFETFLKASGFAFDGVVDIAEEVEFIPEPARCNICGHEEPCPNCEPGDNEEKTEQ